MKKLYIDLETRSRVDLPQRGAYTYAADASTEILIACYAIDDGPIRTWRAWNESTMPHELERALRSHTIVAHNAQFERLMLDASVVGPIDPRHFLCTMTQARAAAMPGSLEDLARALGAKQRKDRRGQELIRLLSIPQEDGSFIERPELYEEFARYCAQDVVVMREAHKLLPAMTDECRALYEASEAVNDRGLPIDIPLCQRALAYREEEAADAEQRIVEVSQGALAKARGTKLTQWVYDRIGVEAQKWMRKHRDDKVSLTLDQGTREVLLNMAEEEPDAIPADVVEVIELAEAVASASVAKFGSMLRLAGHDERLRGAFVLNGAAQTGRFSSKGAQVHNYPRLVAEDPEKVRALMARHAALEGGTMRTLKSMLRPAIRPKKGYIVRGDWSAIEARGLPWLADSAGSRRYLDAFRDPNRDIYIEQAVAAGLGEARQPGKVVVLSLGYGGAEGALRAMSKGYGVPIENPSNVVRMWRNANQWAPEFWFALARAAKASILVKDGAWRNVGRVAFTYGNMGLQMKLPSGRVLHYPFAHVTEGGDIRYLKAAWKPKADATEWPRAKAWHGTFAENATQAACADLLRDSIRRALKQGLPLIGHVHDELVCEAATMAEAKDVARELERCMLQLPDWAAGFPLAAEVHIARTFTK